DLVVHTAAKLPTLFFQDRESQAVGKEDQRLADLGLEQYDDRKTDIEHRVPQDELERRKILFDRDPVEQREQDQTDDRRDRTRSAQQLQDDIHQDKNERDVDDVAKRVYCDEVDELHRLSSEKTRTKSESSA